MPLPKGVGLTSLITAAARHAELSFPEPLIQDPYAGSLAGEEGLEAFQQAIKSDPEMAFIVSLRHRWFDDYILESVYQHHIEQIIILGAGMDTRAWRMKFPKNVTIIEVDLPEVLEYKNRILEDEIPSCNRICVGLDFENTSSFEKIKIDESKPVLWVAEGFVYYLSDDTLQELMKYIQKHSPPRSRLIIDLSSQDVLKFESVSTNIEALEKDFRAQLLNLVSGDPKRLFERYGFTKNIKCVTTQEMIKKMNVEERLSKSLMEKGFQYSYIVTGEK